MRLWSPKAKETTDLQKCKPVRTKKRVKQLRRLKWWSLKRLLAASVFTTPLCRTHSFNNLRNQNWVVSNPMKCSVAVLSYSVSSPIRRTPRLGPLVSYSWATSGRCQLFDAVWLTNKIEVKGQDYSVSYSVSQVVFPIKRLPGLLRREVTKRNGKFHVKVAHSYSWAISDCSVIHQ